MNIATVPDYMKAHAHQLNMISKHCKYQYCYLYSTYVFAWFHVNSSCFRTSSFHSSSIVKTLTHPYTTSFFSPPKTDPHTPKGSPFVIVLTYSALRAVDIIREVKKLELKTVVGKLFARHLKIEEQITLLQKNDIHLVVGTPNRVLKLSEHGALSWSRCQLLIVDANKNEKEFSIFTMKEVKSDVWTLYQKYVHRQVREKGTKICLF